MGSKLSEFLLETCPANEHRRLDDDTFLSHQEGIGIVEFNVPLNTLGL